MAAFAERFGFVFRAHEKGDANRSARVERPFHFIEHNFLAGRTFADLADLNAQARAFCDKVNATPKRHLHASPRELFAAEQPRLRPLPLFVPEVYALHHRLVDVEGYVNVHGHRYSVPYLLIGAAARGARNERSDRRLPRPPARRLACEGPRPDLHARDRARAPAAARRAAQHAAVAGGTGARAGRSAGARVCRRAQGSAVPGAARWRCAGCSRCRASIRAPPFLQAVTLAAQYGLFDLDRLERLIAARDRQGRTSASAPTTRSPTS